MQLHSFLPKCMLMMFSLIILQLGGLTLLAMGIWVTVDGGSFLQMLGPFSGQGMQFVNVGFFCIAIGAVLVLLGLLGCLGAHKESKCLLLTVGAKDSSAESEGVVEVYFTNCKALLFTSCLYTKLQPCLDANICSCYRIILLLL